MFVCLLLSHSPSLFRRALSLPFGFPGYFLPKIQGLIGLSLSLLLRLSGPFPPTTDGVEKRGTVAGFYYLTTKKDLEIPESLAFTGVKKRSRRFFASHSPL